jgi:hypothetical protein
MPSVTRRRKLPTAESLELQLHLRDRIACTKGHKSGERTAHHRNTQSPDRNGHLCSQACDTTDISQLPLYVGRRVLWNATARKTTEHCQHLRGVNSGTMDYSSHATPPDVECFEQHIRICKTFSIEKAPKSNKATRSTSWQRMNEMSLQNK